MMIFMLIMVRRETSLFPAGHVSISKASLCYFQLNEIVGL